MPERWNRWRLKGIRVFLGSVLVLGAAWLPGLAHGEERPVTSEVLAEDAEDAADEGTLNGAEGGEPSLASGAGAEERGSRVYPLAEVLEMAERRSPLMRVADAGLDMSEARAREARALRAPRFEANAMLAPVPGIGEDQEDASDVELLRRLFVSVGPWVRADATAILPLTTFGRIRTARELAAVGVNVAEVERESAVIETRHHVLQAYLVVQWTNEALRLLDEAGSRLDEAEETLEDRLDDGDRRARTHLRQLTIARTRFVRLQGDAERAAFTSRLLLQRALGLPEGFRVESLDEEAVEGELPTLEAVMSFARQRRPDLRQLEAMVEARRLQVMLERRGLTPDTFAAANIRGAWAPSIENRNGPFVHDPYNNFSLGIAVGLRWRVDPWGHAARVQRLDAQLAQAEAQRDGAVLLVEGDIADAWIVARNTQRQLVASERALRAARAWLNQVSFQFDQGLADFDDLIDPLQAYYEAAGDHLEEVLRHRMAVARLAVEVGEPEMTRWPAEAGSSE